MKQILEDNITSLDRLRFFLSLHPELRKDTRAVKSLEDAIMIVCNHTSLMNFQSIAKKFWLLDAIDLIKKFNQSIDEFCKTIPTEHIYGQDFMKHSCKNLLKSEEVKFVLEWDSDKTTLSNIQSLLRKAFHSEARHVMLKVVNGGNSIVVICYAPPHLHEVLKTLVNDNAVHLKETKVISVTIGGFVIFKEETEDEVRLSVFF